MIAVHQNNDQAQSRHMRPEPRITFAGVPEVNPMGLLATREHAVPGWLTDGNRVIRFDY